jgi:serine phosphatase RsbU (regulator of sigma subunit)
MVLMTISYIRAETVMLDLENYFQEYTELNIRERVSLVDSGLKLYDNSLNGQMELAFRPFLDSYIQNAGNVSNIDYPDVKREVSGMLPGNADVYVINRSGIIIRSTVPDSLYLNLSEVDKLKKIPDIINGSSFKADRIVRSYSSIGAQNLTGSLRKFAYMPTPDHLYLLEIGIAALPSMNERSNLSYSIITEEMSDINPYIDEIRIFNVYKNQYVKDGVISSDILDTGTNNRLDEVITTRSDREFLNSDTGQHIQYLFIDQSSPDSVTDMSVIVEIVYSNTSLVKERDQMILFFSVVGCIAVCIGVILTLWCSRWLTKPIIAIIEDVDQIALGDLNHRIRSVEVQEFTWLEQSINLMIHRIRVASEEIERRKAELSIAAEIQQSFLPEILPLIEGYEIAAHSIPAKEVGGDFYDIITYDTVSEQKPKYGVVIADVSGKGVPAALFMSLCRTIVRITINNEYSTAAGLTEANEFITADARSGMFVSLFYAVISDGGDHMTYVNAGHNPPVLYRFSNGTCSLLHEGGIVLGVDNSILLNEEEVDIYPGDIVVFYTDGVTEAIDLSTCMYGEERLCSVIQENAHLSATDILHEILRDLSAFRCDIDQFDDITLVVLKRTNFIPVHG